MLFYYAIGKKGIIKEICICKDLNEKELLPNIMLKTEDLFLMSDELHIKEDKNKDIVLKQKLERRYREWGCFGSLEDIIFFTKEPCYYNPGECHVFKVIFIGNFFEKKTRKV